MPRGRHQLAAYDTKSPIRPSAAASFQAPRPYSAGIQVGHEVSSSPGGLVNLRCAILVPLAVGGAWFAGGRLRSFSLTGDE